MIPHEIPTRPWQNIAADMMTYKGRDYILVGDYYLKYPEVALLRKKTAGDIANNLKSIFARHGIPEKIICDNMPFTSKEFRAFAEEWGRVGKFLPCAVITDTVKILSTMVEMVEMVEIPKVITDTVKILSTIVEMVEILNCPIEENLSTNLLICMYR